MSKKVSKEKPRYTVWQNMSYLIRDVWRKEQSVILVVVAQIFLSVAVALVGIFLPATVVQQITSGVELQVLIITILAFTTGMVILQTINHYLVSSANGRRERILILAICDAMEKTMNTDYANLEHQSFTDAQQKAVGQVLSGGSFMDIWQCFMNFGAGILGFFVYIAVLSVVHPWVFLLAASTCVISVVARHRVNLWWHKNEDRQAAPGKRIRSINHMSERQGLAKDLRLFAMHTWIKELFTANMNLVYSFRKRGEKRNALAGAADALTIFVREGITYIYLIGLVLSGEITPDVFVLLFAAVAGFSGWISDILREWVELSRHGMNIGRMREFLEYPDTFKREGGAEIPKATAYSLELRNVSYQYQGADSNAIENINLHIKPGEKLAVVGLNGAGKTTLVKLMCGLYDPTAGSVLLNGIDIREFNRDEYYALFTAVFQEFNILPATISDNIIQDTTWDNRRVQDAIELAGIQDKISSLPNGADSFLIKEVHLDGEELSGGETQRLMLARALYKNAPILILDEPTAALDPIAESELYSRYAELSKRRTSVYISHRLASTRFCDRIVLIDNKGIAEVGTHDELMKKSGKYAELFEIQSKYYREGVVF
ncbi:MAG: ABC transporter ATP-binding protein/permease [Defluviitaleaceae bacterium]|nr:ABC transporter ATP-binding protein/permease [Defluviitaleaceae bacterium]